MLLFVTQSHGLAGGIKKGGRLQYEAPELWLCIAPELVLRAARPGPLVGVGIVDFFINETILQGQAAFLTTAHKSGRDPASQDSCQNLLRLRNWTLVLLFSVGHRLVSSWLHKLIGLKLTYFLTFRYLF